MSTIDSPRPLRSRRTWFLWETIETIRRNIKAARFMCFGRRQENSSRVWAIPTGFPGGAILRSRLWLGDCGFWQSGGGGAPGDDTRATNWGAAYVYSTADGDFNDDGLYDPADIDGLVAAISGGLIQPRSILPVIAWSTWPIVMVGWFLPELPILPAVTSYFLGDANLDGVVDVQDFTIGMRTSSPPPQNGLRGIGTPTVSRTCKITISGIATSFRAATYVRGQH